MLSKKQVYFKIDSKVLDYSIEKFYNEDYKLYEYESHSDNDFEVKHQKVARKELSNIWDAIIDDYINKGCNFFGITMNFLNMFSEDDPFNDKTFLSLKNILLKIFNNNFPTLEFFMVVSELNKKDKLHVHVFISLKNFIDYNYILKKNIQSCLRRGLVIFDATYGVVLDIRVDSLRKFLDIKKWVIYLHKNYSIFKYPGVIYSKDPIYFNEKLGDMYDYMLRPLENIVIYRIYDYNPTQKDIFGVILKKNTIDLNTLINLIQYYLILNNLFLYKNNVYKKIKKSKISYRLIGSIEDELYNKFQENVVLFFITNYINYFKGFDFNFLINNFLLKSKLSIKEIYDISTNRIKPDFNLCEFQDGIYSIRYDRFFPNTDGNFFNHNISTLKYYNKSYSNVRRNTPKIWLINVLNALDIPFNGGFEEDKTFLNLCKCLSNAFHGDILEKRKLMYLYGDSNSGKTTLIVDFLINYFTKDNIGTISGESEFKWQDLVGKLIAIVDEFKYNTKDLSNLNKLVNNEVLNVPVKYNSLKNLDIRSTYLSSNKAIVENDIDLNNSIKNRINIIRFKNKIRGGKNLKIKIKDEEPNIIIFLNKLLFKNSGTKNFGNRISNLKIIENINKQSM